MYRGVFVASLVLALSGLGCEDALPMAPSDWSRGVIVYEHANYLGESALVDKNISNLDDYKGPCMFTTSYGQGQSDTNYTWKNCISSIRVAAGWKATLYVETDFHGKSVEISSDVSNLQLVAGDCDHDGFNDCIESVRVSRQ
ncbi:MAG: beta/gamma crystallin family protein [Vicinamibacterales bacterium]|nr:beta/gamma crystallin family protein [Vicinamibacterales bacterium]